VPAADAESPAEIRYGVEDLSGLGSEDLETVRAQTTSDIRLIGEAESALLDCSLGGVCDLKPWWLRAVRGALARSKRNLMLSIWSPDWGDKQEFLKWIENGEPDPAPAGIDVAVEIYRIGTAQEIGSGQH
jgi:hypothetical protein